MSAKELQRFTSIGFNSHFGLDITIKPDDEAFSRILNHPTCPVKTLRWAGEFQPVSDQNYWIGGTGPIHNPTTLIFLLGK